MDFSYCEFPSTVSVDTFQAYFNPTDVKLPKANSKSLNQIQAEPSSECQVNEAKSLRHLVLDAIVSNWSGKEEALNWEEKRAEEKRAEEMR